MTIVICLLFLTPLSQITTVLNIIYQKYVVKHYKKIHLWFTTVFYKLKPWQQKISTAESLTKHLRELFVLFNLIFPHFILNYNYDVAWL